ncbi:MAG: hypothetical protein JWN08_3141 [Frankiales bacterium]|nr:hypothetical protein [Frankiales bacterium]
MEVDRDGWMELLGLEADEVPRLLVLESTWWRRRALSRRLAALEDVRELGMPDVWHGWYGDVPVAYCPAYGATRSVEPVHVLGTCGTPVVVSIGACASLQPRVRLGDVVLSERATIGEGASQYYGGKGSVAANLGRVTRAAALFAGRDTFTHRGPTVTAGALLAQPPKLIERWASAGHLAVDLTSSAIFSAAASLTMRAAAVHYVREELPDRPWTSEVTEQEEQLLEAVDEAVYEVALGLV